MQRPTAFSDSSCCCTLGSCVGAGAAAGRLDAQDPQPGANGCNAGGSSTPSAPRTAAQACRQSSAHLGEVDQGHQGGAGRRLWRRHQPEERRQQRGGAARQLRDALGRAGQALHQLRCMLLDGRAAVIQELDQLVQLILLDHCGQLCGAARRMGATCVSGLQAAAGGRRRRRRGRRGQPARGAAIRCGGAVMHCGNAPVCATATAGACWWAGPGGARRCGRAREQ